MSQLPKIEIGTRCLPRRVLLYGIPGVGCSTFAAGSDKPIFIPMESGLDHIDCHRLPRCRRLEEVMKSLRGLHSDPRGYKTVVIDPLEGLERLIGDEVCRDRGLENIEELSFDRGYGLAMTYWHRLLRGLDALRCDFGMTVMLVSHAQFECNDQPMRCRRYIPAVHWRTWLLLQSWCDEVLFATYDWGSGGTDGLQKTFCSDVYSHSQLSPARVIYTTPTPFCVAKNHWDLPVRIPMDFAAFAPSFAVSKPDIASNN